MKPHPTDLLSLVPGLLAVAVATIALTGGLTVDLLATEWLWPAALVVLGVLVLASAGIGRRPRAGADTDGTHGTDGTHAAGEDDADAILEEDTDASVGDTRTT